MVTYLGSRFWTFRHRVNQALLREGTLFVALNVVGLAIAEIVIAVTTYGLDYTVTLAYNAASVVGTGLGTIFRYFSYKKWVFLPGDPGVGRGRRAAGPSGILDYPPETDPGRRGQAAGAEHGHLGGAVSGPPYEAAPTRGPEAEAADPGPASMH